MRWLTLLAILLSLSPATAEEEAGPRCGLFAVVDDGDADMLKIYDGLRKGLELAHLPRVCREPMPGTKAERARFLARIAREKHAPLFVIGDAAAAAFGGPTNDLTRVFALERYTVRGRPLRDLPVLDRSALVYAARSAERVGAILRRLTGRKTVRALVPLDATSAAGGEKRDAFLQAAGITAVTGTAEADLVLDLRLPGRAPYAAALTLARKRGLPLVCDDRARFGHGPVVALVGRHDLVGKAAAECGRRLHADPSVKIPPYGLPGIEVWVDLGAADAQGLELALPFLARADRLKRAPAGRRGAAR